MSKAYKKVMAGLGDARSYLNGERDSFAVHEIEVPEPGHCSDPKQDGGCLNRFLPRVSGCAAWHSQELGAGGAAGQRGRHACFLR